jgi:hypothetical protein
MATATEKKVWAKQLFLKSPLNQKEIAKLIGTTPKTLCAWVKEGKWELVKSSLTITKEQELRRIYTQINELNNDIELRPEGKRYANSKDADVLSKLSATAKNLETETRVADVINVSIELITYLQDADPEKAKEFSNILDSFIKHKLSKFA